MIPAEQGYRWPAEWEPHRATWLSWPHNAETWPDGLGPVEDAFCEIVRALVPGEFVEINVLDQAMAARVKSLLLGAGVPGLDRVRFHLIPTNDAWVRDHGAIFLVNDSPDVDRLALNFEFDAWGGKYPPWDRDAMAARAMATAAGFSVFDSPYVLEAGAIDGDGEGTILTTESCLLNPNRGRPGQARDRESMEALLSQVLGAKRILWLGDGIEGDDTDGHVDDLTRFVAPGRVVTIVESDPGDSNYAILKENSRRLDSMQDGAGRRLEVVELPTPGEIRSRSTLGSGEAATKEGRGRLPASYANFYIGNEVVLVPTFGVDADREALDLMAGCFPSRSVIPIPSRALVEGLGTVHCLTQQEPLL